MKQLHADFFLNRYYAHHLPQNAILKKQNSFFVYCLLKFFCTLKNNNNVFMKYKNDSNLERSFLSTKKAMVQLSTSKTKNI